MASLYASEVRQLLHNKFVVVMGDSIQRAVYKDLVLMLQKDRLLTDQELRERGEISFEHDELLLGGQKTLMNNSIHFREVRQFFSGHHLVRFYFITRVYSEYMESVLEELRTGSYSPDVLIMNSCLWDLSRYGKNPWKSYRKNLESLFLRLQETLPESCLLVWNTAMPLGRKITGSFLPRDQPPSAESLRKDVVEANFYSFNAACKRHFDVLDLHFHFRHSQQHRQTDGVHWNEYAHRHLTQLLLAHMADAWNVELPQREPIHKWPRPRPKSKPKPKSKSRRGRGRGRGRGHDREERRRQEREREQQEWEREWEQERNREWEWNQEWERDHQGREWERDHQGREWERDHQGREWERDHRGREWERDHRDREWDHRDRERDHRERDHRDQEWEHRERDREWGWADQGPEGPPQAGRCHHLGLLSPSTIPCPLPGRGLHSSPIPKALLFPPPHRASQISSLIASKWMGAYPPSQKETFHLGHRHRHPPSANPIFGSGPQGFTEASPAMNLVALMLIGESDRDLPRDRSSETDETLWEGLV
ncbi:PC-esterase domain-containing protein 1B [Rhynchocyon petersi]